MEARDGSSTRKISRSLAEHSDGSEKAKESEILEKSPESEKAQETEKSWFYRIKPQLTRLAEQRKDLRIEREQLCQILDKINAGHCLPLLNQTQEPENQTAHTVDIARLERLALINKKIVHLNARIRELDIALSLYDLLPGPAESICSDSESLRSGESTDGCISPPFFTNMHSRELVRPAPRGRCRSESGGSIRSLDSQPG